MEKKRKALKLSIFEIVWYSLCALVFLWGLTYIILGLVAKYAPLPSADNAVAKASDAYAKVFKMGFFGYGLIHVAVSLVLALIVLLIYSKRTDREFEKEQRRAALRASARKSMGIEENEAVVEAEEKEEPVEEVKEETPAKEPTKDEVPVEETPAEEPSKEETPEEK